MQRRDKQGFKVRREIDLSTTYHESQVDNRTKDSISYQPSIRK